MTESTPVVETASRQTPATVFSAMSEETLAVIDSFPEGSRIHAALFAVAASLPAIEKNGELTFGANTVAFTSIEDIRKALYPAFDRFGIVAYFRLHDSNETLQVAEEPWTAVQAIDPETGKPDPRNGIISESARPIRDGRIPKTRMWAWVEYVAKFVYLGDGSSVEVGPFKGSAYDTDSDKATGKATTAAIKRLLSETFRVIDEKESKDFEETGEDEKNRPDTTDRRSAQEGQGRGPQALAAAAPGAQTRPGRPTRSGPASKPKPEPQPEEPKAAPEPEPQPEQSTPQPEPTPEHPSDEALAQADQGTGEVPEEPTSTPEETVEPEKPGAAPVAPMPDRLAAAKSRVADANKVLGLTKAEVDAIAAEVTGIAKREDWITKGTAVAKLADALEARLKDQG